MKERNILGHRMRLQRESRGLSKSEFSRQVGVTPTAVHNWEENGVVPRAEMLAEIAKVLRVSAEDLTDRSGSTIAATELDVPGELELTFDAIKQRLARMFNVEPFQIAITIQL